jgi:hypothetical protein
MSRAKRCSDYVTYYERYKEERKEINRVRALEYYYKNIEKRREYNKNYWKDNYNELYTKRLLKDDIDDMKLKEYQKHYYEKTKYGNKTNINDVYHLVLKKDNPEFKKIDMVIKCYFD